jgi:hypothetical protein
MSNKNFNYLNLKSREMSKYDVGIVGKMFCRWFLALRLQEVLYRWIVMLDSQTLIINELREMEISPMRFFH